MRSARLAVDGGNPVRESLLPYGRQTIDDDDIRAVDQVLRSDFLTTGPQIEKFESALAEVAGIGFATVVSSGTAALHAMYAAARIGEGDEVKLKILRIEPERRRLGLSLKAAEEELL